MIHNTDCVCGFFNLAVGGCYSVVLVTAKVLSYREKKSSDPIPDLKLSRRIRRMMRFQISLHPFDAIVLLPSTAAFSHHAQQPSPTTQTQTQTQTPSSPSDDAQDTFASSCLSFSRRSPLPHTTQTPPPTTGTLLRAITPHSIPVSPHARQRVTRAFHHLADDVLYQARDQLRKELADILASPDHSQRSRSGGDLPPLLFNHHIPTFNRADCHEDLCLSCGSHAVTKRGNGLYRSVRTTRSIQRRRRVYFQMTVSSLGNSREEGTRDEKDKKKTSSRKDNNVDRTTTMASSSSSSSSPQTTTFMTTPFFYWFVKSRDAVDVARGHL